MSDEELITTDAYGRVPRSLLELGRERNVTPAEFDMLRDHFKNDCTMIAEYIESQTVRGTFKMEWPRITMAGPGRADFAVGDTVKFALPAPGHEGNRFVAEGTMEALYPDGTRTGSVKVMVRTTTEPLVRFVATADDLVKA